LAVYPAAGLIDYVPLEVSKYLIDPKPVNIHHKQNLTIINEMASVGVPELVNRLLATIDG
jgi:NAD-dependent deacetylase